LVAVGPAALVLRRRWPGAVLLAAFCSTLAYWLLDYPGGPIFLSLIIALFSAVRAGQRCSPG
jgi:hypothetical protein